MSLCFLDDEIISLDKASLSLTDLTILRGYGIFDFLKIVNHKPFLLDQHLKRFRNSAELSHLKIPLSDAKIRTVIHELIQKSEIKNPCIKILLTAGDGKRKDSSKLFIFTEDMPIYDPILHERGIILKSMYFQRENPLIKSTNYFNLFINKQTMQLNSDEDLLYYGQNGVSECPRANIFMVKDGEIWTPKNHVLHGITRLWCLKISRKKMHIKEMDFTLETLLNADEAFITSTTRGIMPVHKIDNIVFSNGKIGQITQELKDDYFEDLGAN